MLTGFRLTLPDGTVFRATSNVSVEPEQETSFVYDGLRNALALFESNDSTGGGDGQKQSVFLGSGAGIQRITVSFIQYEESTDQWGGSNPEDSARSKRDTLNHALESVSIDSESPATLEWGEYSAEGKFSGKGVVVKNSRLPFDPEQEASSFSGTITFLEAADLREIINGVERTG